MLNLMNDIIDISIIESGEIKIWKADCDILKKIDYILKFFSKEASVKELLLTFNNSLSPGDSHVNTDPEKLEAILINLVKNAIKFTQNGTVEISCSKKDGFYRFSVSDSGVGIDPKHQGIIFDRFRQASESLSRPYEGAGLGLSISKAYVEMLGGKIWVESEIGKGSVFHFTLPDENEHMEDAHVQDNTIKVKDSGQAGELKILIGEDNDVSMTYMEIITKALCKKYSRHIQALKP